MKKEQLQARQNELRLRLRKERQTRRDYEHRLATGAATEQDLLDAMRQGRLRSREDAKRAWGL
jgi:hypothetical protein